VPTSNNPVPEPADKDVRYERVDSLTVHVFVEGAGDTTVRPASAAVKKMLERDREQIAELIARAKREQEKLNGG
jgi:hypothetical protein